MTCTHCGNKDAYLSFSSVECPNPVCRFYKPPEGEGVVNFNTPGGDLVVEFRIAEGRVLCHNPLREAVGLFWQIVDDWTKGERATITYGFEQMIEIKPRRRQIRHKFADPGTVLTLSELERLAPPYKYTLP